MVRLIILARSTSESCLARRAERLVDHIELQNVSDELPPRRKDRAGGLRNRKTDVGALCSGCKAERTHISTASLTPSIHSHCARSEEHTSELQSHVNLVCRLL